MRERCPRVERNDDQSGMPTSPSALSSEGSSTSHPQLVSPVDELDHVRGSDRATTTLVMYSDFECLHCRRAYATVKRLLAELPGMVRLVFRHFPLVHDHPHAGIAAKAAEAAARQGRFWKMHDMLFANQRALHASALRDYAGTLGLDLEQFDRDLADAAIKERVERDIASGRAIGVRGTPEFFLNGWRLGNPWDLSALRTTIERAVESAWPLFSPLLRAQ
jgi:protein-disulfide isomerase